VVSEGTGRNLRPPSEGEGPIAAATVEPIATRDTLDLRELSTPNTYAPRSTVLMSTSAISPAREQSIPSTESIPPTDINAISDSRGQSMLSTSGTQDPTATNVISGSRGQSMLSTSGTEDPTATNVISASRGQSMPSTSGIRSTELTSTGDTLPVRRQSILSTENTSLTATNVISGLREQSTPNT
jgi:hypothetical protein